MCDQTRKNSIEIRFFVKIIKSIINHYKKSIENTSIIQHTMQKCLTANLCNTDSNTREGEKIFITIFKFIKYEKDSYGQMKSLVEKE